MEEKSYKKYVMYAGWALSLIQLVISIVLEVMIIKMNLLPLKYVIFIGVALLIVDVVIAVAQKWFVPGIITKIISVILCVAMVVSCMYVNATDDTISKITGVTTKIDNINVYVLKDDKAETITDAKDYKFGILKELDRTNTDTVLEGFSEELGQNIDTTEYEGLTDIVDALYNGDVEAIVLNTAYIGIITEQTGYEDFESKVKSVYYKDIESQVQAEAPTLGENETENPYKEYEDYLYNGDEIFTLYVSGIDTTGTPNVNRNSDVNILLTVNINTRQILMISTPRDYYVTLPIDGGVKDKLTHAGCHGIDVSLGTLENLYGVNIDYYLKINFTGFVDVIDALGGVYVNSDNEFTVGSYTYVIGDNFLNGAQALAFARERYSFASGDRQRGKNQMKVINAVIKGLTTTDALLNYTSILNALSNSMVTNMTYDKITDLVKMQLSDMQGWNIVSYSVDGSNGNDYCYSLGANNYVMYPNDSTVNHAKELLRSIYSGNIVSE